MTVIIKRYEFAFLNILSKIQWDVLHQKNATTNGFINKIITPQRTRSNTIGRRSTRVLMTRRAFPLWLERQTSTVLSFVMFSYQFSSVICLFSQCIKVKLMLYYFYTYFLFCTIFFSKSKETPTWCNTVQVLFLQSHSIQFIQFHLTYTMIHGSTKLQFIFFSV